MAKSMGKAPRGKKLAGHKGEELPTPKRSKHSAKKKAKGFMSKMFGKGKG